MRRRIMSIAGLVVAFLLIAPAAYAKGPAGATIEGDSMKGAVVVLERGELGQGTAMSRLVEAVGFFELTFGKSPSVHSDQPTKALGKERLVITWDMTGGDSIVQEIYTHAAGGPVTYVAPGQEFWEDPWATVGGWLTITGDLATPLIELGVDEAAVAHLVKRAEPVKKAELVKKAEPVKKGEMVKEAEPVKKAELVKKAESVKEADAAPAAASGPVAQSSGIDGSSGLGGTLIASAILLIAGIIGAGTWMRRRRPVPR